MSLTFETMYEKKKYSTDTWHFDNLNNKRKRGEVDGPFWSLDTDTLKDQNSDFKIVVKSPSENDDGFEYLEDEVFEHHGTFHVHKRILGSMSRYFERMFRGSNAESRADQTELVLQKDVAHLFGTALDSMYHPYSVHIHLYTFRGTAPDTNHAITPVNCIQFAQLADHLEIESLCKQIKRNIVDMDPSDLMASSLWRQATRLDMVDIQNQILNWTIRHKQIDNFAPSDILVSLIKRIQQNEQLRTTHKDWITDEIRTYFEGCSVEGVTRGTFENIFSIQTLIPIEMILSPSNARTLLILYEKFYPILSSSQSSGMRLRSFEAKCLPLLVVDKKKRIAYLGAADKIEFLSLLSGRIIRALQAYELGVPTNHLLINAATATAQT
jgi:BTB/POZ domain